MNGPLRIAALAIVAVLAVGGVAYVLGVAGPGGRASAVPSAAASPSQAAASSPAPTVGSSPSRPVSPSPAPTGPVSFTSPVYGYTVSRPGDWLVTAARVPWAEGSTCCQRTNLDSFEAPRSMSPDFDYVIVAAQPVPEGMTDADWRLRHAQQQAASGRDCKGAVDDWTDATVGSLATIRVDLECEGLRLSDVAFAFDGTGYVMSGNSKVIDLFLNTFKPGN